MCVMKQGPTVCLRRPHIWRFEVRVLSFRLCFGICEGETLRSVSPHAEGVPWDTTTFRHYADLAKCHINLYIQIRPFWIVVMCKYSKWTICYQHWVLLRLTFIQTDWDSFVLMINSFSYKKNFQKKEQCLRCLKLLCDCVSQTSALHDTWCSDIMQCSVTENI